MASGFPPKPVYPLAIDSDRTLYLVYNTSETTLTADNNAWSDEIRIKPVDPGMPEIWADNGFANIEGEMFYYDAVAKNSDGKVFKLRRCARGIGGKNPKFNPSGTWVRGFVVAEHHNQLVDAIVKVELAAKNLGDIIARLNQEEVCSDDHSCADVNFEFEIDEEASDNCRGKIANYNVQIDGNFTDFRIDFGDGTSSTVQSGIHIYPPNATMDPVVTVSNANCSVVITPTNRTPRVEPQIPTPNVFEIPIPDPISFPDLVFDCPGIPETTLKLPPFIGPCLDLGPLGPISVPSVLIVRPPINLPSRISFTPVNLPSRITITSTFTIPSTISFVNVPSFTTISFGQAPKFPSIIRFGNIPSLPRTISITGVVNIPDSINVIDTIPNTIRVTDSIPNKINIQGKVPDKIKIDGKIPSKIKIDGKIPNKIKLEGKIPSKIKFDKAPKVSVNWGKPPKISVVIKCPNNSGGSGSLREELSAMNEGGLPLLDDSDLFGNLEYKTSDLGIPDEIIIVPPTFPDVKFTHDLPKSIPLIAPTIPDIKIIGPAVPLPTEIRIIDPGIPSRIEIKSNIPSCIKIDASDLPKVVRLEVPEELPKILLDATGIPDHIQVKGIPDSIVVKGFPSEIITRVVLPESVEVPLVYKGGPIPVQFDLKAFGDDDGDYPCFALRPCKPKS